MDLYSQPNYISVGPTNGDYMLIISGPHQWRLYIGNQWAPLIKIIRWYSMDPVNEDYMLVIDGYVSEDCALVFNGSC